MNFQYLPIVLVVFSGLSYHLLQKITPGSLNPIVALIITYVCATIVSIVSFFIFVPKGNLFESMKAANWTSYLLGFAVVGLELGFLLAYRSGLNISITSLITNTLIAIVLIPIGLLLFKENISLTGITGIVLCIVGIILISKK